MLEIYVPLKTHTRAHVCVCVCVNACTYVWLCYVESEIVVKIYD